MEPSEDKQNGAEITPNSAEGQTGPAAEPVVEEVSPKRSVWYFLFSPETRTGRFMRPVLRGTAFVVALFALGVLAAYILLYQPTTRKLNQANTNLQNTQQTADSIKADLGQARSDLDKAENQNQTLDADLKLTQVRLGLSKMMNQVSMTRFALASKDAKAAKTALDQAAVEMEDFLPYVQQKDPEVAKSIELRVQIISAELTRDTKTALSDLDILNSMLVLLDQTLVEE